MCVLIVKPAGKKMLTRDILDACQKKNPDGCGFVSKSRNYKGLDYERFLRELALVPDNEACIIHFRWATHGRVKQSNCHPFVADNGGKEVWFAHNGILDIPVVGDLTDSEVAFRTRIMPAVRMFGYDSKQVADAVGRIIGGSKFAMMCEGNIRMFGRFTEVDGIYYSNLHFMPYVRDPFRMYGMAM